MDRSLSSLPGCHLTRCFSWGVSILSSSPFEDCGEWSLLSVRRLPSTCGRLPAVSVVFSKTRFSSIGMSYNPLWPVSYIWAWGCYQKLAVTLPYILVQTCLSPYPQLSWVLKCPPSQPLPPMMPWLPVCFLLAPAFCAGTQFSNDPVRCSCDMLSAAPLMILIQSHSTSRNNVGSNEWPTDL